ncbi:MAG: hypothetical protein JXR60_02945 [Bacteroidales bacterium]|nr:hypothetical protein [Bacteroidales bacterium]
MKIILLFTFLSYSVVTYSKSYDNYTIDFDNQYFLDRLVIDTVYNPNNIWQIGSPQKNTFVSVYSIPKVIVTDTINSYPNNDTSQFVIKYVSDELGGVQWPHTVILAGQYQVNSDTLYDFGMIEFSPDNGNHRHFRNQS